jgi:hypothetical protein
MDQQEGGELQTACTRIIIKFRLHCFDITDLAAIQDARVAAIKEIQEASDKFFAATTLTETTIATHDAYIRHVSALLDFRRSPVEQ